MRRLYSAALACALLVSAPASASVIYTYTSTNPAAGGFQTTPYSWSFTTDVPLAANIPFPTIVFGHVDLQDSGLYNTPGITSWSYTIDGHTMGSTYIDPYLQWLVISTDAKGNVVDWYGRLDAGNAAFGGGFTSYGPHDSFYDNSVDRIWRFGSPNGSSIDTTFFFTRGTWSISTDGAVPEPATWMMMLGGFGLIGGAVRRDRRRRRAPVSV